MNKENKFDYDWLNEHEWILELAMGGLFIGGNDFNSGMLLEKIVVLLGFIIFVVGIVRGIMKYKEKNKKGMIIFLSLMGIIALGTFLALLYRFIFA